jgi:hypothetical protein
MAAGPVGSITIGLEANEALPRCRGRLRRPVGDTVRRSSSQRGRPSKHPCNFPLSGERGALCRGTRSPKNRPKLRHGVIAQARFDGDFCVPARYGLNASACGHAVQFPQLPALPRATWTLYARSPVQPAPVVLGGFSRQGTRASVRRLCTGRRAKTVRSRPGD